MARTVVEIKKNRNGKWYVLEKGGNGEPMNHSQPYSTKSNAVRAGRKRARRSNSKLVIDEA